MVNKGRELDITIESDRDLSLVSCNRVCIKMAEDGRYRVTSSLRFWRGGDHSFLSKLLRRRMPGLRFIAGNCSAPSGYFWGT